ncbi:MAG: hypothetical protein H0U52_05815 [Chloroflexi bacterium]|nr:hypothetical protein [Chloroflexota bacterium]
MTRVDGTARRGRFRPVHLLLVVAVGVLVGFGIYALVSALTEPRRAAAPYDPPVLAGQQVWGACAGGFYARRGDEMVLTSSGHCTTEGTVAYEPDGRTVRGVFGPIAHDSSCPHAGHTCHASDMNYLVVAADRIPWGHLNVVDLGSAGNRVIPPGTAPLACGDIAIGDRVEIDGRNIYRSGTVTGKGQNLQPVALDGSYFPCMVLGDIPVAGGDSGGAVLVRGIPAGVTSRSFAGSIGFTPLAEGLAQLGLALCTTPDCDLTRPRSSAP